MLEKETIEKLRKPLDPTRIKTRAGGGGRDLAYLKGHNVIDMANEVFGFGQWGYDLLNVELVNVVGEDGQIVGGYYAARVRLTVAGCQPITEEGVNPIQEGRNPRARIDAHDMARKGAVTDAMKRAFRCFGDQFGNSLYDNEPGGDGDTRRSAPAQSSQQSRPVQPSQAGRPVTQPASATPKPVPTNPKQDKNYIHYSKELTACRTVKDLEEIKVAIGAEVQDEGVKELLRVEFRQAQERIKKASLAATSNFDDVPDLSFDQMQD
jgi:DNA recombination protein Rad52